MIVYEMLNTITDERYIGQTRQLLRMRKSGHFFLLRRNTFKDTPLQIAYNKYGEKAFVFNELCRCSSQKELDAKETEYIQKFGDYNINMASRGNKFTKRTKEKIGKAHKGKIITALHRKTLSDANHGIKHPQCKLTELDVYNIKFRTDYSEWGSKTRTAEKYGVDRSVIVKITRGYKWSWITENSLENMCCTQLNT